MSVDIIKVILQNFEINSFKFVYTVEYLNFSKIAWRKWFNSKSNLVNIYLMILFQYSKWDKAILPNVDLEDFFGRFLKHDNFIVYKMILVYCSHKFWFNILKLNSIKDYKSVATILKVNLEGWNLV